MDRRRRRRPRKTSVEWLENRMVMSADPLSDLGQSIEQHFHEIEQHLQDEAALAQHAVVDGLSPALVQHELGDPDFWYDPSFEVDLIDTLDQIEQHLANAHNLTGLTQVRCDYGFRGVGQTVAVIDTGIAWDHYALGGRLGPNYRVVGGWDFTEENDANPYDDGAEGSHGTHVAGIIGANPNGASTHTGVATGVDLVGLRVFNDIGNGYFHWVEQALQWVHANRNAFENPITAVNLSLGTAWNATTVPSWSTLENEFAQLKADGIFVSVSAGNAFTTYNTPGLSYPAASPHVVPVMSTEDNGLMSGFSQRHTSAIAAPGRTIMSTVPDYLGNNNGVADDWGSKSGTSMAAPYVAGASVLIREAMEFVGYTNITQQTIYDHMRATAVNFFDAVTNQTYKRLHLGNAINALMPTDDFGSTTGTAHNLGTIGGSAAVSGVIARLNDVDYFSFTAGVTGTVSFTADTSHYLAPVWAHSGTGWTSGADGETYTMEVVAGQTYTIGLSTGDGLGHYDLTIDAASSGPSFTFTDWGTISQSQINDRSITTEAWFRVRTSQAGYLTGEAFFTGASGNVDLEWYDANQQLLVTGTGATNSERAELFAGTGQTFFLKVLGTNSNVDFRVTNLVSHAGSTVTVNGTAGADVFTFSTGSSQRTLVVNSVTYQFNNASATSITFNGGGGSNSITMTGSTGNDAATLGSTTSQLSGTGYAVTALNVTNVVVHAGGGTDSVTLVDSAGDDVFTTWSDRVLMTGAGYSLDARNFDSALAYASIGYDRTHFNDSAGNDVYESWSDRATISGSGFVGDARGFDHTFALASTGNDVAIFHGTTGDDTYTSWWDRQRFIGPGFHNESLFFDSSVIYAAGGGYDRGFFYDTVGDDDYEALWNRVTMTGAGYSNAGWGFDWTFAQALGGHDEAVIYDSAGDDTYIAWWDRQRMTGAGFHNEMLFFDRTAAHSNGGGYDRATFYDTGGDDVFATWWDHAVMMGNGFFNDSFGFEYLWGHASGGHDQSFHQDSSGDDSYTAWRDRVVMAGPGYGSEAWNFDRTAGFASGGYDRVSLYDSPGNDMFLFWPDHGVLFGPGFFNDTFGFESVLAQSSAGFDTANFYDSAGDDIFEAWSTRAVMRGGGYLNDARGFDRCYAFASTGNDRATVYDTPKNDNVVARGNSAYITGTGYFNEAFGFDHVAALSTSGGKDKAFIALTDYVFERIGSWRS